MKIQDIEWAVYTKRWAKTHYYYVAKANKDSGIHIIESLLFNDEEQCKKHWKDFARDNGITKWRYV